MVPTSVKMSQLLLCCFRYVLCTQQLVWDMVLVYIIVRFSRPLLGWFVFITHMHSYGGKPMTVSVHIQRKDLSSPALSLGFFLRMLVFREAFPLRGFTISRLGQSWEKIQKMTLDMVILQALLPLQFVCYCKLFRVLNQLLFYDVQNLEL